MPHPISLVLCIALSWHATPHFPCPANSSIPWFTTLHDPYTAPYSVAYWTAHTPHTLPCGQPYPMAQQAPHPITPYPIHSSIPWFTNWLSQPEFQVNMDDTSVQPLSYQTDLLLLVSNFGSVQLVDEHLVLHGDTDVPCWTQVTTREKWRPWGIRQPNNLECYHIWNLECYHMWHLKCYHIWQSNNPECYHIRQPNNLECYHIRQLNNLECYHTRQPGVLPYKANKQPGVLPYMVVKQFGHLTQTSLQQSKINKLAVD